jgi:hypothetical protein
MLAESASKAADDEAQVLTLPRVAAVQSLDTPDC